MLIPRIPGLTFQPGQARPGQARRAAESKVGPSRVHDAVDNTGTPAEAVDRGSRSGSSRRYRRST